VGYSPDVDNLQTTLENYARIVRMAQSHGRGIVGARVLEIGSGWFPLIPVLLCQDGASEVVMTDVTPHFDPITFQAALAFMRQHYSASEAVGRVQRFEDLPLRYLAPFDPQTLADGSIDLVVSRTVLEHIPPGIIVDLLRALKPKLAPGGRMVHLVDHSDHLQHIDRSLSPVQFLGWSERRHSLVNWLTGEGENRLRHHEYPPLFRSAGFKVLAEEGEVHAAALASLATVGLVPPWDRMQPEQLAVLVSAYALAPQ
jgi:hypothetical protein